jgi:hypothetical protein
VSSDSAKPISNRRTAAPAAVASVADIVLPP